MKKSPETVQLFEVAGKFVKPNTENACAWWHEVSVDPTRSPSVACKFNTEQQIFLHIFTLVVPEYMWSKFCSLQMPKFDDLLMIFHLQTVHVKELERDLVIQLSDSVFWSLCGSFYTHKHVPFTNEFCIFQVNECLHWRCWLYCATAFICTECRVSQGYHS